MPVYDYKCPNCQNEFEKNVKVAFYQDPQPCPDCNTDSGRIVKGAPSMGDPVRLGIRRPDDLWRDTLRRIADTTPGGKGLRNNSSYI